MADPRNVSDNLFIQLLREGRHDAEIAVRLGVTSGEVRERKAALRRKLGDEAYLQLLDPARPQRRHLGRKWRKRIVIVSGVAAVLALLLVVANLVVGEEEAIAPARASLSPTARPAAKLAKTVTLDGVDYDDAGAFITVASNAAASFAEIANRPGLNHVTLSETTFLSATEFAQWTRVGGSRGQLRLRATLNGRVVELQISSGNQSTRLRSLTASVGPVAEVSSQFGSMQAAFFLRAYDGDGRQIQALLQDDGRLLIGRGSFPAEWVIDRATGQRVAMADGITIGRLSIPSDMGASNACRVTADELLCMVRWKGGVGMIAEVAGAAACTPTTQIFTTADVRVELNRTSGVVCRGGEITPGLPIAGAGDWDIGATSASGEPLSIAITAGGKFVVGRATGELTCPCLND